MGLVVPHLDCVVRTGAVLRVQDPKADIAIVGTETVGARSVYRLRVKGQLGLHNRGAGPDLPIAKDVLVDALTYDIVSVEDRPFQRYERGGNLSDKPSRVIEFGDFRTVNGVRVPFLITTELMGQKTLTIQLNNVSFNTNLRDQDFEN